MTDIAAVGLGFGVGFALAFAWAYHRAARANADALAEAEARLRTAWERNDRQAATIRRLQAECGERAERVETAAVQWARGTGGAGAVALPPRVRFWLN